MVNHNSVEEHDEHNKAHIHNNSKHTNSHTTLGELIKPDRSTDEDLYGEASDSDSDGGISAEGSDEEEDAIAAQVASLVYSNSKDDNDINYDHYQFSVAQKFDFTSYNLLYKKYKYIQDEVFLNLHWKSRFTLQYKVTVLIIIFMFWIRMFLHYIV